MECPKCHSIIDDNSAVCPNCHKVFLLECPNCHELSDSAVCAKCGYTILIKCAKCSKINPTINDLCSKCGFPVKNSLAYQECETDEFASVTIKFNNLKKIQKALKTKELYNKFFNKLKNLIFAYTKNNDGKFIIYRQTVFVLNFNKELSFPTSANKAVRFSIKLINALTELNSNILEEFGIPLGLNITLLKKTAENLQDFYSIDNNVKLLNISGSNKKYLKGTKIVLDQFIYDEIHKAYKTDSLYSLEENGQTTMFYEIILDNYVLPPENQKNAEPIKAYEHIIRKNKNSGNEENNSDSIYSFKVFDINAKCKFETSSSANIKEKLDTIDFKKDCKILSIRSNAQNSADIYELAEYFKALDYKVIPVTCTEKTAYLPWGIFQAVFRTYFDLSYDKSLNNTPNEIIQKYFAPLFNLSCGEAVKSLSPEDARFTYMELWSKFLSILKNTVIIIDGIEYFDDTTKQTLELYFDKYTNIVPNFVFITNDKIALHSKISSLLRTSHYTEIELEKSSFSSCISKFKSDAEDFINSFYFAKLQENFNGSYLYFKYVVKYLKETGVLIDFENKLIVKDSKSVVIANDLDGIYKSRMKHLSENPDMAFLFAYSEMLSPDLDNKVLEKLGIKNLKEAVQTLENSELILKYENKVIINNFNLFSSVIKSSLKKEAEEMLAKNIFVHLGSSLGDAPTADNFGRLGAYKEEYLTLCNNSEFAMLSGDFDAYLKNCLTFLSLIESVGTDVSLENIAARKKEVYNNILLCLYAYAPEKIYFIENILLLDAMNEQDNDKIVKLSNLMLQGALISSNYTDAQGLIYNILSRMQNPTLIVDGAINTRFLLLSLVNIEIMYNIGQFKSCVELAAEILSVIKPDIIEKIKPRSFSVNSFVTHLLETFKLAALAKIYLTDDDIENYLNLIAAALGAELPEKDCIIAIKDFLADKTYKIENIEEYSPFSKIIFLILQEFSNLKNDYSQFAQNIYQAKLLAYDIHQKELELFCDLLIGWAYFKVGITQKSKAIYADVTAYAEKSAMFNIYHIGNYLTALLEKTSNPERALSLISGSIDEISKKGVESKILYVLFEKLYIDMEQASETTDCDIESEQQKILQFADKLKRLFNEDAEKVKK